MSASGPAWLSRLHAAPQSPAQVGGLRTDVKSRLVRGQDITVLWKQVREVLGENGKIESVAKSGWKWQQAVAAMSSAPTSTTPPTSLPGLAAAPVPDASPFAGVDQFQYHVKPVVKQHKDVVMRAAQACAVRKRQLSTVGVYDRFGDLGKSPSSESTISVSSTGHVPQQSHAQAPAPRATFLDGKRRRFE